MPGPEEIRPEHLMAAQEDPLDLRGKLTSGRISVNVARRCERKLEAFQRGEMNGRWASPEIEEFFNHMLAHRLKMWHEMTDEMFRLGLENERSMRPGQQVSNLEYCTMAFSYIDKVLLNCYMDYFTLASEFVDVARAMSRLARNLDEVESNRIVLGDVLPDGDKP